MNKKYIIFALTSFAGSFLFLILLFLCADLFINNHLGELAVYNYRGYRGPVLGTKSSNEVRIITLGGSTTLGYGVKYKYSWPSLLERNLNDHFVPQGKFFKVINVAYNNEGAYAFSFNLKDFKYLDYDIAIFYSGYNDLGGVNNTLYRQSSPIFRLFGYMPILPTYLNEKANDILYGGDGKGHPAARGKKTTFKPNILEKTQAETLKLGLKVFRSLEKQLQRFSKIQHEQAIQGKDYWHNYKHNVKKAIDLTLSMRKKAIFVTQPYMGESQVDQQTSTKKMFDKEYSGNRSFYYANLLNAVDLKNQDLSYDGMHLTPKGNYIIAKELEKKMINFISDLTNIPQKSVEKIIEEAKPSINNIDNSITIYE